MCLYIRVEQSIIFITIKLSLVDKLRLQFCTLLLNINNFNQFLMYFVQHKTRIIKYII